MSNFANIWNRWSIFLCIGIAVLGAQIAPFLVEGRCHIVSWAGTAWYKDWVSPRDYVMVKDRDTNAPRVGSAYVLAYVAAALLAVLVDPTRN